MFSILYLILLAYYNWRLSLVALAIMLLSLWIVTHFAKRTVRAQRANLAVQGKVSALVYQMISGIAKLRVAAAEGRLFARWAEGFKKQAELSFRSHQLQNVIKVYNDILPDLSALALFWIAGYLVRNGHTIDTADFISFNAAYGALFASLTQLSQTLVHVMGVQHLIQIRFGALQTPTKHVDELQQQRSHVLGVVEVGEPPQDRVRFAGGSAHD